MRLFMTLFLLVGFYNTIWGETFEFKAYGSTQKQAKENALLELANFLSVKVESNFTSYADNKGAKESAQTLKVSSNLPLGGARVSVIKSGEDFEAIASLEPSFALHFYESTLVSLKNQIALLAVKLPQQKGEAKEQTLELLYPLVIEFDKYHAIYKLLGGATPIVSAITAAEISLQLLALGDEVDTIAMAIKRLTSDLKLQSVYITPITPDASHIPTPFSSLFLDKMTGVLHPVVHQNEAKMILGGRYHVDSNGMQITLILTDALNGKTLDTRSVKLLPKGYQAYAYQSVDSEFDRAMASGVAVDATFHASLMTNKGNNNLLFKAGDEIKVGVKLNKPGYFYIVAHVKNPKDTMSYLLPIYETARGNDRFIRYVPANEVNREISLGEFTVEPPYGIESLQMIASTAPITQLPSTYERDGYTLLKEGNIASALSNTRALKIKSNTKSLSAEATLSYLTVNK